MSALAEIRSLFERRALKLLALGVLLALVAGRSLELKFCILDLDIWWHLKVGQWIVQHFAVPHTGILSRTAADRAWVAYSWGYEVLLAAAYRWFGLVGIGIYGVLLTLSVAYSVFWMTLRLSGRFWWSCLLSAATCSAFLYSIMPRPVFFSMTLFTVVLSLLLEAGRTGQMRTLYWLPPIFVVWANLHIQFIYGLFLVGLFAAANVALWAMAHWNITSRFVFAPALPANKLVGLFFVCTIASCFGPYGYHLFPVVYEYSKAKVPYTMIRELQPINFKLGSHYVQLLLTGAGFFALGWRKKVDLFKASLLTIATVVAYRTMRDSWFICIPAAAVIADFPVEEKARERSVGWAEGGALAVFVGLALVLFAQNTDFNQRGLDRAISSMYPVDAVNFLRRNPQPQPLYNNLDWGGFLMWYMPDYPVAIDGRNDLYGDDLDREFFDAENGRPSYATDPYLKQAGVVLLEKRLPLAQILVTDPRFSLIYQDQKSAVFVPKEPGQE